MGEASRDWGKVDVESRKAIAASVAKQGARQGRGRNLEQMDPERATMLLERMAGGDSLRKICKEDGTNHGMLCNLRARHAEALGKRREMLAQDAMELAEKARGLQHEKMNMLFDDPEALAKTNLRDLAMSYGIYADKFHQSTEGNVVTIQHKGGAPSIEDAMKVIEAARAKLKAAATEINVTPTEAA